jgi:LysR family transcriptional regulator, regulator for genes of the gallate degradation pathway
LRELARYEWILPARGAPRREAFERLFAGSARRPIVRVETTSLEIYKSVLATSNMIALLSTAVEAQLGEALMILPFDSPALARNDGVASRADWKPTLLHQQFLELLRKEALQYQHTRTVPAGLNGRLPAQAL